MTNSAQRRRRYFKSRRSRSALPQPRPDMQLGQRLQRLWAAVCQTIRALDCGYAHTYQAWRHDSRDGED